MPPRWLQHVRRPVVVPYVAAERAGVPAGAAARLTRGNLARFRLVAVPVENFWLERPLGDDWLAAYRFTRQDGQPVISELRIFPAEGEDRSISPDYILSERTARPPGQWRAELLGSMAPAPRGGLTARLVHRLRLGALLRHARADLATLRRDTPSLFAPLEPYASFSAVAARAALTERRPGRKGHGLLFFARIARAYVARLRAEDPHPAVTIARRLGLTPAGARDMIHRARNRGLLTKALAQGQRGGALTPKALAILREGAAKRSARNARKPIATRRAPGKRRQRRTR